MARKVLVAGTAALVAAAIVAGCTSQGASLESRRSAKAACADVVFPIYFAQGSDQLTQGADQVISSAVSQVRGCRIGYVSVLGLTDAAGSAAQNLDLSKRRADTVARALSSAGLSTPRFEVNAAGENGAVSEKGRPVPLRRKTEVVIHALPA